MRGLILIVFATSLFAITSCNKDEEVLGETTIAARDGFALTSSFTLNTSTVNFANGEAVTASASFNQEVTYKIKVTGLTSGAYRNFSGTGKSIDPVSFQWKGRHEGLHFFEEGEDAEVILSFFGSNDTHRQIIKISSLYNYLSHPDLYASHLMTNEHGSYASADSWQNNLNAGSWGGGIYGDDERDTAGFFGTKIINEKDLGAKIPQGTHAFSLKSKGDKNGYQIGFGSQIYSSQTTLNTPNAENTWVNLYIYGEGRSDVTLEFSITEDDCSINCDFCSGCLNQDVRFIHIPITHSGWKLFSFRYTDLKTTHYKGRKGNEIPEPSEFVNYAIGLISNGKKPQTLVTDMPFITYGKPFIPEEF